MKKTGHILLLLIILGMTATILCFLFGKYVKSPFISDNLLNRRQEETAAQQESGRDLSDTEMTETGWENVTQNYKVSRKGMGILPYDANTVALGETFQVEDERLSVKVQCCVNDVKYTTENVNTDAVYFALEDQRIKMDEQYRLLDDFIYIVANVTIKNLSEHVYEPYMNSFWYVAVDPETEDACDIFMRGELGGYKTEADLLEYDKSYAKITLAPQEEYTCNLVYIQKKEDLQGKTPYIKYWPSGVILSDPKEDLLTRYVRLKDYDEKTD